MRASTTSAGPSPPATRCTWPSPSSPPCSPRPSRGSRARGATSSPRRTEARPMRYLVLAGDFDGTLATEGTVSGETMAALHRLRDSGRNVVLGRGREIAVLVGIFPDVDRFDRVVAENGRVSYRPASREHTTLGEAPPPRRLRPPRSR